MIELTSDLIKLLRSARHVAVLTGAGVSAESGIPTFREAQTGLWAQYDPQDLATPEAFVRNPRLVWEWYAWRRELVSKAKPNAGHFALAEMARHVARFTLITQNVDGLHQQAGSAAVIELHGNLQRTKCFREEIVIDDWVDTGEAPPRCPRCGDRLRPDVVWFGEPLPSAALHAAAEAATTCDVFFSIGTSGLVEPAASLARTAMQHGAKVIEINPVATPLTSMVTYALHAASGEVLPALLRAVWPEG
ncbi:MAG: NAD-dependent deacylase [Chloroflexi bacterium]|nr:NAD-dependent deacylase [Chloroflexota bacterium]